jgi:tRNA(Leu) C34 or U34 (ribose-2'-O)-methylase TrmL
MLQIAANIGCCTDLCACAGAGNSGVEFAGYSNDLTTLADARTDQSAQATAFPYNILQPVGTLTCTQVGGQKGTQQYRG